MEKLETKSGIREAWEASENMGGGDAAQNSAAQGVESENIYTAMDELRTISHYSIENLKRFHRWRTRALFRLA